MLPSASSVTTWSPLPSRHRTRPYPRPFDWWSSRPCLLRTSKLWFLASPSGSLGSSLALFKQRPPKAGSPILTRSRYARSRCPPHGTLTGRTPGPSDTNQELRSIPGPKTRAKAPASHVRSIGHSLPVEPVPMRRTIVEDDEALDRKGAHRSWNHSVMRPRAEEVKQP
jgi:hypothetical protein